MRAAVQEIRDNPENANKNRMGVLLGNRSFDKTTQTLTHVLWALFNVLPGHTVQVRAEMFKHPHQTQIVPTCQPL